MTEQTKDSLFSLLKCIATVLLVIHLPMIWLLCVFSLTTPGIWSGFGHILTVIIAGSVLALLYVPRKKRVMLCIAVALAVFFSAFGINHAIHAYDQSLVVDTTPNIDVNAYLPFNNDSKIVTLESEPSLKLAKDLPVLDGAAAVFPVYSAFVNATYPSYTQLNGGVFEYNNTITGYEKLAQRETDIFFGGYPSAEQISYAESQGTEFVYTPIGNEAFVFFVHKDNPVENLTTQQVQDIYAGKITNWKEVGGKNEAITAYQRNEGSGSQSRLIRFMDGRKLVDPPTEEVVGMMMGIVEEVANYRSKSGSIGFSFRYYVEGIVQNPDIKLLSIDGVAPTVENIKNGSYPLVEPLYAVTWAGNDNENVDTLLAWILSEEGQYIIEKTGYAGVSVKP